MKYLLVAIIIICFVGLIIFLSSKNNQQTTNATLGAQIVAQSSGPCKARYLSTTDPQAVLPDENCTPGAVNPAVTQSTIDQTICDPGYSKTIRPSASYTNRLKHKQIVEYGYTDPSVRDYEEDHFISLELGGSPTDPKNLWPEPHGSLNEKDKVEDYLHEQVCNGSITLEKAQQEITTNWYQVYQQLP